MSAELHEYRNPQRFLSWPQRRPEPAEIIALPSVMPDLSTDECAGLMETALASIPSKAGRAEFWHGHVETLGSYFHFDCGIPREVVEAGLRAHLLAVRRIHAERMALTPGQRRIERGPINFSEPPEVGHEIKVVGKIARVVAVEPYTRKSDGVASFVIRWDIEGRKATTGLRSASFMFDREADDA